MAISYSFYSLRLAASVFLTFLGLGLTAFGGPAAHIGFFRRVFVENKQWLSDQHFAQFLALCQFLPGPASSQLGFLIGYSRAGWLGGLAAFIAFTLPTTAMLVALAYGLNMFDSDAVSALMHGFKLVACVVVIDALWGMAKHLCPDKSRQCIALISAACVLILPFAFIHIMVMAICALVGWRLYGRDPVTTSLAMPMLISRKVGLFLLTIFFALLCILPFFANLHPLINVAHVFYQAGAFVFGGGHVVLPLLEQALVPNGLIDADAFLMGYGALQAMPGPLFSFAAYLGAVMPLGVPPIWGAGIALLLIFLPGFLLVLGVLPFWHSLSAMPKMSGAIKGINAAVVGLLAAVLYTPISTQAVLVPSDMAIVLIGVGLLSVLRVSPLWVVIVCVLAGYMSAI